MRTGRKSAGAVLLLSAIGCATGAPPAGAAPGSLVLASGSPAASESPTVSAPALSATGRHIAFTSAAALVPDDTNEAFDVFVRDLATGRTLRASVSSAEAQGSDDASPGDAPALSADGRHVAFTSSADDLVAGDTNRRPDVFVRDTVAGTTRRVSVGVDGAQLAAGGSAPSISADGTRIAFVTDTRAVPGDRNDGSDVYLRDLRAGSTARVSSPAAGLPDQGGSASPALSGDGRAVAFSTAAVLVRGDTNARSDVHLRDLAAGTTTRVSVSSQERQVGDHSLYPAISRDGRFVAFTSRAAGLVPGDTNGVLDTFLRDRSAGTTTRVSVSSTGGQADSFEPAESGLTPTVSVSADGRWVAFSSPATDLVPGDTNALHDVFVRDRRSGTTTRVSTTGSGAQAGDLSGQPVLSAGGGAVAFRSYAPLTAADRDGYVDVYVRRGTGG